MGNREALEALVSESFPNPSARQQVQIERARTLAARLDGEVDGSKVAALSREHRMVLHDLVLQVAAMSNGQPVEAAPAPDATVVSADRVAQLREAAARRRRDATAGA